jgi:large conductance mechanosensitive channel
MKNGIFQEFKEFAIKGNVVDLAVGVIIGSAFGNIINSLVKDIIMPPISMLSNGIDFATRAIVLRQATATNPAVAINYGLFLNNVISFLIIAFSIFIFVKQINKLKRKDQEKPPVEQTLSTTEKLLTEIKELLEAKKEKVTIDMHK